jgi:site-specific DNA-methyltransferase (adenine-specific)
MSRVERIGDATLYLGDAREVVMGLGVLDSVVSDPPYGMAFRSNSRIEKHAAIQNDEDAELLLFACAIPVMHSKYLFCRWDNLQEVPKPKSLITWVKNNWSMGDLQHEHGRQTEVALFYPGPEHDFPAGRPTDVIHAPRTGNEFHPTEKPVSLMAAFIQWTRGAVLDPFMGSGTTGVACVQLRREFIGVEVDQAHFSTACRRIEQAYKQRPLFDSEPPNKPEQLEIT